MAAAFTRRDDLPDLPFQRYRKHPKPVTAVRLTEPEDLPHPHAAGSFHGEPGDWRITYGTRPDGSLDTAICQADVFAKTYEHLEGDQYRKKATALVDAAQLDAPLNIVTMEGSAHGQPGDWLLIGVEGEPYFNSDDFFKENYVLAE